MTKRDDPPPKQENIRKPYSPPTLVEYGNIAKLTQSGQGSAGDGGLIGGMMMMCL